MAQYCGSVWAISLHILCSASWCYQEGTSYFQPQRDPTRTETSLPRWFLGICSLLKISMNYTSQFQSSLWKRDSGFLVFTPWYISPHLRYRSSQTCRSLKVPLQPWKNDAQTYIYFQLRGTPQADRRNLREAAISLHWLQRVKGGGHLEDYFNIPYFNAQRLETTCLGTHQRRTISKQKPDPSPGNMGSSVWTQAKPAAFLLSVVFIAWRENSWCLKPTRSYKKFLTLFISSEITESKIS